MSGTYPASPILNRLEYSSFAPIRLTIANDQTRRARSNLTQRWLFDGFYSRKLTRAQLGPLFAFAVKQKGPFDTFLFIPPVISDTKGTMAGVPLVNGARQTGTSIDIDDCPLASIVLKAEDFLLFAGHSKVYMVTEDVLSNGSGEATVNFEPPLLESPANNALVTYDAVPFTCSFNQETIRTLLSAPLNHDYAMQLIEVP